MINSTIKLFLVSILLIYLCSCAKDVNITMQQAIIKGNIEEVKKLMSSNALKNKPFLLFLAIDKKQYEILKILLENGYTSSPDKAESPIRYACQKGDVKALNILLQHGADANETSKDDFTPLMSAAYGGHLECVKTLIAHGAKINTSDKLSFPAGTGTPLYKALVNGHPLVVEELLKNGAKYDISYLQKKLNIYIEFKKNKNLEAALMFPVNINYLNKDGVTPLMLAASFQNLDAIKVLIEKGAKINLQGTGAAEKGWTALDCANATSTTEDRAQIIKFLKSHGAKTGEELKNESSPAPSTSGKIL
ncbi:MAG: hypothetical protein A2017_03915 [Lentisphaerae bacterium GWF2_44_16]|nr:MAG: hypothetical protein A2017_03915 [Lentisphaerae bacterium GWF2_44_16]